MHFEITTALGLFEALGGIEATSKSYDLAMPGIHKWAVTGNIPTGWHLRMFAHAWSLGKTTDPRVWGFESADPAYHNLAELQWLPRRGAQIGGTHAWS
jgi:hypothetical protein